MHVAFFLGVKSNIESDIKRLEISPEYKALISQVYINSTDLRIGDLIGRGTLGHCTRTCIHVEGRDLCVINSYFINMTLLGHFGRVYEAVLMQENNASYQKVAVKIAKCVYENEGRYCVLCWLFLTMLKVDLR